MTRMLLQILCAPGDADAIVAALRPACPEPVHVTAVRVHGRDFSDARTSEQVDGALERRMVSVAIDGGLMDATIARAVSARRRQPLRWQVLPLIAEGRAA